MILPAQVLRAIAGVLRRRWLLVGVGNDLRGDDSFGPLLARRLRRAGLPALDAGIAPEVHSGSILGAAPEELILADAVDMGEAVGTVALLGAGQIRGGGPSTHDPGLGLLLEYLGRRHEMNVTVLALQPGPRALGDPLSPEVVEAIEEVSDAFRRFAAA